MEKYSSFQFSWFTLIIIPIMSFIYYAFDTQAGTNPIPFLPMIISLSICLLIFLLFYGMYVKIIDKVIIIRFGIGIIRKKIDISTIKSIKKVRNKWYYGLGIKVIPNGMFYGVHGLNTLELAFKESKRIIRIGTNDGDNLKYALNKIIE